MTNQEIQTYAKYYLWLRDKALDTPDTAPIVYLADGNGSPLECQQLVGAELDAAMRRVLEGGREA